MDWMVLEKISCLYDSRSKLLYPPVWILASRIALERNLISCQDNISNARQTAWMVYFRSVDLENGQNRRTSNSIDDEILSDSPVSNSKIFISFFAISLSLCSWLSISSLPKKRKSAMRKMLGTKCGRQNRTRFTYGPRHRRCQ